MRELLRRVVRAVQNLHHAPAIVRLADDLYEAQADAARQDFVAADKRLLRISESSLPQHVVDQSTATLLKALVSLRLGDPAAAAELAPTGVRNVESLRAYANPEERAYLAYAGRLILEEATDQLGDPMTLDVGVDYDELDIGRVRSALRDAFPIYRSRYADVPQVH